MAGAWTNIFQNVVEMPTVSCSMSMSNHVVLDIEPKHVLFNQEVVQSKAQAIASETLLAQDLSVHGILFLTNYRLIFLAFLTEEHARLEHQQPQIHFSIPLPSIAEMTLQCATSTDTTQRGKELCSTIEFSCKNYEIFRFGFFYEPASIELVQVLMELKTSSLCNAADFLLMYPKRHQLPDHEGWSLYNPREEYKRQLAASNVADSTMYRLSHANVDFRLCDTYPKYLLVPASITDEEMFKIARYRKRSRIPAITYIHSNGSTIARCSQPLIGIRRTRNVWDEAFVAAMRQSSATNDGKIYFIDCRNQTSAFGNMALGGGFENVSNYQNSEILFLGIENIHSMRDSFYRFYKLVKAEHRGNEKAHWLSQLESTRWLEHVRSILVSTTQCVDIMTKKNSSLVVHCSDGWDRTAQIVSLTKLCLDPYYRTIKGFAVLIEQDWCSFGHRFAERCGFTNSNFQYWAENECSPVFPQFIDAVWQLIQHYPCSFEFNAFYLMKLLDELYSGLSGTFSFNSEKERFQKQICEKSISTWTRLQAFISESAENFNNPFFVDVLAPGCDTSCPIILNAPSHTSSLTLWTDYYLRCLNIPRTTEAPYSQVRWAQEQKKAQDRLQNEILTIQEQLQRQQAQLLSKLEMVEREKHQLQQALDGQVFQDRSNGVVVHERSVDDDDDGIVVSMVHTLSDAETDCIEVKLHAPITVIASYFASS